MVDMNVMIASNILALLKSQNRKQIDLADALKTNKQTVNKMLNGTRMINAVELKAIADYLGVRMEELTKISKSLSLISLLVSFVLTNTSFIIISSVSIFIGNSLLVAKLYNNVSPL